MVKVGKHQRELGGGARCFIAIKESEGYAIDNERDIAIAKR